MKLKKILGRIADFFNADIKKQKKEIKSLTKLLKALKRKERELTDKIAQPDLSQEQRENVQNKIDVVKAQRSKGVAQLQTLRGHGKACESAKTATESAVRVETQPVEADTITANVNQANTEASPALSMQAEPATQTEKV